MFFILFNSQNSLHYDNKDVTVTKDFLKITVLKNYNYLQQRKKYNTHFLQFHNFNEIRTIDDGIKQ